eukprot:1161583-Pelagomonas_calceolata.AAC.2
MQPRKRTQRSSSHAACLQEPFPLFQMSQALESNHKTNSTGKLAGHPRHGLATAVQKPLNH